MGFRVSYSFIEELLRDYYQEKCLKDNLEFELSVKEVPGNAHGWFEGDTYHQMSITLTKRRSVNFVLKNRNISFPVVTSETITNNEIEDILKRIIDNSLEGEGLCVSYFSLDASGVIVYVEYKKDKQLVLVNENDQMR